MLRPLLVMLLCCASHCLLICAGLVILSALVWVLAALGAQDLVLLVYGLGIILNIPFSFVLTVRLVRRFDPERSAEPEAR